MPDKVEKNEEVVLDDSNLVRGQYSDVCNNCKHYISEYKCKAFAEIPLEIWLGENKHDKPYEGDNGITFTPKVSKSKKPSLVKSKTL